MKTRRTHTTIRAYRTTMALCHSPALSACTIIESNSAMPICEEISSSKNFALVSFPEFGSQTDEPASLTHPPTLPPFQLFPPCLLPRSLAKNWHSPASSGQTSFLRSNSIFTQSRRSCDSIFPQFLLHRCMLVETRLGNFN